MESNKKSYYIRLNRLKPNKNLKPLVKDKLQETLIDLGQNVKPISRDQSHLSSRSSIVRINIDPWQIATKVTLLCQPTPPCRVMELCFLKLCLLDPLSYIQSLKEDGCIMT